MKFNVLKDDFLVAVQTVQYSSNAKGMMPILSGVKIEGVKDGLFLHATDLESYSSSACPANVEEEGACVVSTKVLLDYLRDSGDEKISAEMEGNELKLEGSSSVFKLYTMPVEDFPDLPSVEVPAVLGLETSRFLSSIQKVAKAASRDEKRPTLMGILFEVKEDALTMVSTDSYRLAISNVVGEHESKEAGQYIIPASAMVNLARIAAKAEKIDFYRDENQAQVRFRLDGIDYIIRLIEGKFPKYSQFIPGVFEKVVEVDKAVFLGAIKRAGLVSSTVKMSIKRNNITLMSESREVGEGKEDVEASYEGEEMEIAFNGRFLEDGLTSLEGERAQLVLSEPLKPGVVKEKEKDDFMYIIMPIRL